MATRETSLWQWLAKAKPIFRDALHILRLENMVGAGTPDCEGCLTGGQFWLELKCADRPKLSNSPVRVKFQPKQVPWIIRRGKAGGRVFVLLQVGSGREAKRYLIGHNDVEVVEAGVNEAYLELASIGPPDMTPCEAIRLAAGSNYMANKT